jgi:hypothetical protein
MNLTIGTLILAGLSAQDTPLEFNLTRAEAGEFLASKPTPTRSAKELLRRSLTSLGGGYFAGRPVVFRSMSDSKDTEVQALFVATLKGKLVQGIAISLRQGDRGSICILYCAKDRFAQSIGPLFELARKSGWCGNAQAVLRRVRLTDGSGTIALPEGWRITGAVNGMVSAEGPHGAVDLGIWATVATPELAAMSLFRPPLVAAYRDPESAVRDVMPQVLPGMRYLRTLDKADSQWPNGQAQFLHYEWDRGEGAERWQTVCLQIMAPNVDGTWLYYNSAVHSPAAKMAENLPTLLKIWSGWKVDDRVFQERLNRAVRSMRETSDIIVRGHEERTRTIDGALRAWSYAFRGDAPTRDNQTGRVTDERRYENGADLEKTVEWLNRQEGWERYQILDPKELE